MKIILAKNRGFCSGVKRSIRLAEKALAEISGPIYILNDIVHNQAVIDNLKQKGLVRVDDANKVKTGTLVISAHGIPRNIITEAKVRGLDVIDTTCPLVYRIHDTAKGLIDSGYVVILFGDPGHDEVKGIRTVDPDNIHILDSIDDINDLPQFVKPIAFISQSTRSIAEFDKTAERLRQRYGSVRVENTICRATRLRQESIHQLAKQVESVIVVGSKTSANSNRLVEAALSHGIKAYLIDNADELNTAWLDGIENLGVTSGASTPEDLVDEVLAKIKNIALAGGIEVEITEL